MTKPLCIRLPDEIWTRLGAIQDILITRTGGVKMPFSQVVLHVLQAGLNVVEKEVQQ